MANLRVTPGAGAPTTVKFSGRTYTAAFGATIDVPDFDAVILEANGWLVVPADVTANRPAPVRNTLFLDTTLGKLIKADGKQWHDMNNGAVV